MKRKGIGHIGGRRQDKTLKKRSPGAWGKSIKAYMKLISGKGK